MNTWLCMKDNMVVNAIHATEDFIKNDSWCRNNYTGYINYDLISKSMNPAPWIGSFVTDGMWTIVPVLEHEPLTIDAYIKTENNNHILRWIKNIPHFIRCGLHSGIRPCCVFFFALAYALPVSTKFWNKITHTYDSMNRSPVIACPACLILKREKQEFKPCNCLPVGHPSKV